MERDVGKYRYSTNKLVKSRNKEITHMSAEGDSHTSAEGEFVLLSWLLAILSLQGNNFGSFELISFSSASRRGHHLHESSSKEHPKEPTVSCNPPFFMLSFAEQTKEPSSGGVVVWDTVGSLFSGECVVSDMQCKTKQTKQKEKDKREKDQCKKYECCAHHLSLFSVHRISVYTKCDNWTD